MNLPKSIRVGPYQYSITREKDLKSSKGESCWGTCNIPLQSIKLDTGLTPVREAVIVIHESLHAIWEQMGLPAKYEEKTIEVLSPLLTQFIRDNPKLIKYIQEVQ